MKVEAEHLKSIGNELFKKGCYIDALNHYTQAIIVLPSEPGYYTNRAMAQMKLGNYELAITDCQLATEKDPQFSKSFHKQFKCNVALGDLKEASINLQKAIEFEQNNNNLKNDLKELNNLKIIQQLIDKSIQNG